MIELISVPIVDFFISDNYLVTHNTQSEILSSTITKIIFFIVCNIIKKVSEIEINVTKSIWLFIVPIMSLICGLSITSLCNEKNGQIFDNVILVFSVSMLIINLVAFGVHESYVKKVNETEKMKLLEQKKELDYEHYKLLQMEYNNSRAIIHDMKHHINTISAFVDNKDEKGLKKYIDSLRKQNQKFSGQVYTGNKIIDIIIYQKFEVSRKAGIDFIFKSNNITLDFIDEVDICCILSNLIDNAIESAQKSENKKIELIFYSNEQKTIYFIEIVNSCDFAPIVKNGTMITNKSDKRYHGVGLYSVEQTLKNYSGYISYLYDNDNHIFKTTVTIGK